MPPAQADYKQSKAHKVPIERTAYTKTKAHKVPKGQKGSLPTAKQMDRCDQIHLSTQTLVAKKLN
jgi:hypothetical protein